MALHNYFGGNGLRTILSKIKNIISTKMDTDGSNSASTVKFKAVTASKTISSTGAISSKDNITASHDIVAKQMFGYDESTTSFYKNNFRNIHIHNTAAGTAVLWNNNIAFLVFNSGEAEANSDWLFSVKIHLLQTTLALYDVTANIDITSLTLYNGTTAVQTIPSSSGYTYTTDCWQTGDILTLDIAFTIPSTYITSTIATNLNKVFFSAAPGFSCVYPVDGLAVNCSISFGTKFVDTFDMNGYIYNELSGNTISTTIFHDVLDQHIKTYVGTFYIPTGGPRWVVDIGVEPGTSYIAYSNIIKSDTNAYYNHAISFTGVPTEVVTTPTAPTLPAPPAGKVISFVGTSWCPFVAGVAGSISAHSNSYSGLRLIELAVMPQKIRLMGYHSNNTPTAGHGMTVNLYQIA